jgi:predicted  nucleic acid-binding Zn-ribbon protein
VDKTLYDLEQELESIPQRLQELDEAETVLKEAVAKDEADLAQIVKQRKELEKANDDIRARIRKAENRLMSSKTQREYRAANAEIDEGKDSLKATEEVLLELMERQEGLESKLKGLKADLKNIGAQAAEKRKSLGKRSKSLQKEIDKLNKSRGGLTHSVEKELMGRYDFIRKNRQGVALAAVQDGTCQACHMRLPPQQFNELQRMDKVMSCPSCRRIIYWADADSLADLCGSEGG